MRILDWICFFLDWRDIHESWSEDCDHTYDPRYDPSYDHDYDNRYESIFDRGYESVVKVEPDYFLFDEETGIIHNI